MALTGGRMGGHRSELSRSPSPPSEEELDFHWGVFVVVAVVVVVIVVAAIVTDVDVHPVTESFTIVELQVATKGVTKYLQDALNRIAETADTSAPTGLADILRDTSKTLRKKLDRCISVYSNVKEENVHRVAMNLHRRISLSERLKFDEETLVNTNLEEKRLEGCLKYRATYKELASDFAVVTFVVAVRGDYKLPAIRSRKDLQKALDILVSIPARNIEALEVLWAPQQPNDILTEKELHERYPSLTPL